jgi:hypothetical protein
MHPAPINPRASDAGKEPMVLEGGDDYLFLTGGNHRTLSLIREENQPKASSIEAFWSNLQGRRALCQEMGAAYVHLVSPDKAFVQRENFPIKIGIPILERYRQALASTTRDETQAHLCYPLDALRDEPQQVCSKVDSHFTPIGSLCCLESVLKLAIKQHPLSDASNKESRATEKLSDQGILANTPHKQEITNQVDAEKNSCIHPPVSSIDPSILRLWVLENTIEQGVWSGDLGSKLDPPREETKATIKIPRSIKLISNQIIRGNDGICDIFINSDHIADSPRALIFGDSFARGLAPMLSRMFGIVMFCRSRYVHDEIVRGFKPQLVISQNAERYLANVTHDDLRPPFLLYPSLRAEPLPVPNQFSKLMATCMAVERTPFHRLIEQVQQGIPMDNLSF